MMLNTLSKKTDVSWIEAQAESSHRGFGSGNKVLTEATLST